MTIGIGSPIAVVGAGAIGCYFGGMLARAGANVTLIGRHQHVDAIKRDGLLLQSREFSGYIPVAATEHMAAVGGAGLVLFCVKSADTDDAARQMAPQLAADAAVLSLQNGVNNVERIRRHVQAPVIAGLVYAAAEMSGPGAVRHTGGGSLVIGRLNALSGDQDPRLLAEIAALFTGAGIAVKISADAQNRLDQLVQAGVFRSRAEAAAFLIDEGVKTQSALFDRVEQKLAEIEKLRAELRGMIIERAN